MSTNIPITPPCNTHSEVVTTFMVEGDRIVRTEREINDFMVTSTKNGFQSGNVHINNLTSQLDSVLFLGDGWHIDRETGAIFNENVLDVTMELGENTHDLENANLPGATTLLFGENDKGVPHDYLSFGDGVDMDSTWEEVWGEQREEDARRPRENPVPY